MSRPIYRAALGRTAKLGSLYDIRTDSFLHDTLFTSDPDDELVDTIEPGGNIIDLVLTDNLQEKFNKLNVEADLQASFMAGLVKLKGSGAYLGENRKSARARSMSLLCNIKTVNEEISIRHNKGIVDMSILNGETTDATHVVVGIEWGGICTVTCEYKSSQDENVVKVEGALKAEVDMLKAIVSLSGGAKAEYDDREKESHTKFTFKCTSDVSPSDKELPMTFDEAVILARNIPGLVKDTNNGKGVPLTYILQPLQSVRQMFKLETHIQTCTAIDNEIIKKCTQIAEGITRKRQALYDIQMDLHASRDYLGEGSLRKIDEILETFDVEESGFKTKLRNVLVGVRSGEKHISSIGELISNGLPVVLRDSTHTGQLDSFQNDLRKVKSIRSLKEKGIVYVGKKDVFRVGDMDKGYILYTNGNTEYKKIHDKNLELFLRLQKTHGNNYRFIIVDRELTEDPCPTSKVKPTIHRVVDGFTKCEDVQAKEGEDLKMCLIRIDSPVRILGRLPSDRAPVKLRCPNSLHHNGECKGDPTHWKCSKCKDLVEYSIIEKRFYCGCGKSSTGKALFRCNGQQHGMKYLKFPTSILDDELAGQRPREETNILILGETGVGKYTWINGFMNYIYFSDMEDAMNSDEFHVLIPSKFNFIQDGVTKDIHVGGSDSNENVMAGESATQEPRGYIFYVGDHLIRLIDTPGIGDSRGIEQDKKNFDSILSYLTYYEEIHAVCILLKPNNARLNVMFRFCIQELLAHLHTSIKYNIVFCFTNARSTFYQPGDTLQPLNRELRNKNVGIEANRNNYFCFDNESFRFLACLKNGVKFNEGEIKTYAESWNKSVETTGCLLRHIRCLTPKKVKDTTTLNEARRIIVAMSKPLTEVSKIILENVASGDSAKEKICLGNKDMDDMQRKLKFPGFNLVREDLGYPRTVCTVYDNDEKKSCVRLVPVGETGVQNRVYKQICHDGCSLTGIPTEQTNDERLSRCYICMFGHDCHVCGHHYTKHMHITYDTQIVNVEFLSKEVQYQINSQKKKVDQIKEFRKAIQEKNDELMSEQATIIKTSARFGSFLKANAIIPYNDAVGDYLDMSIHEEKMKPKLIRSDAKLDAMRTRRSEYQKEKEILDKAISDGTTTNMTTELNDILKLHRELFKLKHMGKTLETLFNGASISHSANNVNFHEKIAPIAPHNPSRLSRVKTWFGF